MSSYRVHAFRSTANVVAEDGRVIGRAGMETWCGVVYPGWGRDDKSDQKCIICLAEVAKVGGTIRFWASKDD